MLSHYFYPVDQYYASLAASSAAASAQPTPSATGMASSSNSPDFPNTQDEDEVDRKPNVELLDSLGAYRKRSRSQEDVGGASKIKQAKVEGVNGFHNASEFYTNGNGHPVVNGYGHANGNGVVHSFEAEAADAFMFNQYEDAEPLDDPMVDGESSYFD